MRNTSTTIILLFGLLAANLSLGCIYGQTVLNEKDETDKATSAQDEVKAEVQRIGTKYKMPNMFACYQTLGQPMVGYAGGKRKNNSEVRVTLDDKIHLGSLSLIHI